MAGSSSLSSKLGGFGNLSCARLGWAFLHLAGQPARSKAKRRRRGRLSSEPEGPISSREAAAKVKWPPDSPGYNRPAAFNRIEWAHFQLHANGREINFANERLASAFWPAAA